MHGKKNAKNSIKHDVKEIESYFNNEKHVTTNISINDNGGTVQIIFVTVMFFITTIFRTFTNFPDQTLNN